MEDILGNPVGRASPVALAGINDFVSGFLAYEKKAENIVAAANAGEGNQRADIGPPARQRFRLGGGVERLALQAHGGQGGHRDNVARPRPRR